MIIFPKYKLLKINAININVALILIDIDEFLKKLYKTLPSTIASYIMLDDEKKGTIIKVLKLLK